MVGIYNGIIDHTVPPNAGSFRRVEILVRENCCVGIPRHPYSCSVATTNLADRVSNPVQVALAELADGFGMAETGPIIPAGMGVISGRDPRHGDAAFVNQIFLACTGGAGTPVSDGFLSIIHVGNAGMCRHDSIEVDELHHPLLVTPTATWCRTPRAPGASAARSRPTSSSARSRAARCEVLYTSDGTINPAKGARGGLPGGRARALKRERDGRADAELPNCHGVTLAPGERIVSYSAGGGGYGPPLRARPGARQARSRRGLDQPRRGPQTVYGVVLDRQGAIDQRGDHGATRRAGRAGRATDAGQRGVGRAYALHAGDRRRRHLHRLRRL